jgi:O-acetyl-ADP-ribose deacetylase (regulator of RNase III)
MLVTMNQEDSRSPLPSYGQLLEELKTIRRPGLADLRRTERPALSAAAVAGGFCAGPDQIPAGIEALLKESVRRLGENDLLGQAAAHTFGLLPGRRGAPASERRKEAALVYGVSPERFRRQQEPQVVEQLAEAVLGVLRGPTPLSARVPRARAGQEQPPLRVDSVPVAPAADAGGGTFTLHVSPIELLRDIDVLVSSENVYLEMSKTFRRTVSAALRLAAAVRDGAGEITDDVLVRELSGWLCAHGHPGLPVRTGTVVPTSPGALASRGVRRIYHAAVAAPDGDGYRVQGESIARAVGECFALARAERDGCQPGLKSICFPLLGAGHGGLPPTVSVHWLRWAIRDELARDPHWQVHVVIHSRRTAEAVGAL